MTRPTSMLVPVLLALLPAQLSAQACFGIAGGSRSAVTASVGFPAERVTAYSVSGITTTGRSMFVGANGGVTTARIITGHGVIQTNLKELGATLGYEADALHEVASVCPRIDASYSFTDHATVTTVPMGMGIGRTFTLGIGETATLTPHLTPQFIWRQTNYQDYGAETDTYFRLHGGATAGFGRILFGGFVTKYFLRGSKAFFGVQAGYAF